MLPMVFITLGIEIECDEVKMEEKMKLIGIIEKEHN